MGKSKPGFLDMIKALANRDMLVIFLLGISSGLPILLVYFSLKFWLRKEGIDLSTIGYITWMAIPYSINFLWAPLLDRVYSSRVGRRRGWILLTQLCLIACMIGLYFVDVETNLQAIIIIGCLVAFFSATQDISVDAYRREILPDNELGLGAALGVYGYRIGMWLTTGLGIWVVDPETLGMSFQESFLMMGHFYFIGIFAVFLAKEPKIQKLEQGEIGIFAPFIDLWKRQGILFLLLFILLYKFGDALAGTMLPALYVDTGFDPKIVAEIPKTLGLVLSLIGLGVGGMVIYRLGIVPSLWLAGILQAISTLAFGFLYLYPNNYVLTGVVAFEDLSSGMGTAALIAFMSVMSDKRFTASQYALFASLASFGRTFFAGFAGDMAEVYGWFLFFIVCGIMAIPGLICLAHLQNDFKRALESRS